MYTHLDVAEPLDLRVIEGARGRRYVTPTGDTYPSITTMLGSIEKPAITNWRNSLGVEKADKETARAAARGTAIHALIEQRLRNAPDPIAAAFATKLPIALDHINEYKTLRFALNKINNIHLLEGALYSDTLKVAGRVDCIAEYNGSLAVIDFKTSTGSKTESMIGDYFLQTTAYALMYQEIYNIQVDNIVIIMSVERGAVPLVFVKTVDEFIEPLVRRINTYYTSLENSK